MSSPFQKAFSAKSPLNTNTTGGGYDKEIHKVASVPDKHATNITGKYDKAYDEYTSKHGYIDPDKFDNMQEKNKNKNKEK
jgi:hypothetical protein